MVLQSFLALLQTVVQPFLKARVVAQHLVLQLCKDLDRQGQHLLQVVQLHLAMRGMLFVRDL